MMPCALREIGEREVHLWVIRLEASESAIERCRSWLAEHERERAARFHFERSRRAYVLGRGVLRAMIGAYTSARPESVQFCYGAKGKPALADGAPLRFNVSNSADLAAYAFTNRCEIGVDVEHIRPMRDLESIARRFFAPEEVAELMDLGEEGRPSGFFNCWTRKEAYIKAVGDGLYVLLNTFRVTLRPGVAARITHLGASEEAARGWTLDAFDPAPGYAGAIAYPDKPRALV